MGIEFMTFGMTLFILKLLVVAAIAVYITTILMRWAEGKKPTKLNIFGIIIGILILFLPTNLQPKLSIEPSLTYEQQTYQSNDEPIVIQPVPPRTEILDGFTPMSK